MPTVIDFGALAVAHVSDTVLENLKSNPSVELQPYVIEPDMEMFCDVYTGKIGPDIPKQFRKNIYNSVHNLALYGTSATIF